MEQTKTLRPGELLAEMIGVHYEAPVKSPRTAEQVLMEVLLESQRKAMKTVRNMPDDQRREYMRNAKQKSRAGSKERMDAGNIDPSPQNVREVLADAALAILASGGAGAEHVMKALTLAFPDKPGVWVTVQAKAKTGKLEAKLVDLVIGY